MTVRLTIRTAEWRAGVAQVAATTPGLVPVVKGNGYGFGRPALAELAAELADVVAVGTVHELGDVPGSVDALVLTPTLRAPESTRPILTVAGTEHLAALDGWHGRVVIKVESSMHRYGTSRPHDMVDAARAAGLTVCGIALHPPLEVDAHRNVDEVRDVLSTLGGDEVVWLSHLSPEEYGSLPTDRDYRLRLGTRLWLGTRQSLRLHADVLAVRPVASGTVAGYRRTPAATDGHLVMIGAGSANGVAPLPDGRSPFHHARTRMPLHEAPHMHTSMCLVADGDPVPDVGDWVDLQRPLTMTYVDEYHWA